MVLKLLQNADAAGTSVKVTQSLTHSLLAMTTFLRRRLVIQLMTIPLSSAIYLLSTVYATDLRNKDEYIISFSLMYLFQSILPHHPPTDELVFLDANFLQCFPPLNCWCSAILRVTCQITVTFPLFHLSLSRSNSSSIK